MASSISEPPSAFIPLETYHNTKTDIVLSSSVPSSTMSSFVSDSTSIQSVTDEKSTTLPHKSQHRWIRHVRHTCLNVYRRIFSVVFVANIIALIFVLLHNYEQSSDRLTDIATAASVNTMVVILIRQDYIINGIFRICWSATFLPLRCRRVLAKCYEFGGVVCSLFFMLSFRITPTTPICRVLSREYRVVISIFFQGPAS